MLCQPRHFTVAYTNEGIPLKEGQPFYMAHMVHWIICSMVVVVVFQSAIEGDRLKSNLLQQAKAQAQVQEPQAADLPLKNRSSWDGSHMGLFLGSAEDVCEDAFLYYLFCGNYYMVLRMRGWVT